MEYTRTLKKGMFGEDVRYIKECLLVLKYYNNKISIITHNRFGSDTEKTIEQYQKSKQLEVTGEVDEKTWKLIVEDFKNFTEISFSRTLKKGMNGKDVRFMKNCLLRLGYYKSTVDRITHNSFGTDTARAVEKFQNNNKELSSSLTLVKGEIDKKTWEAIKEDYYKGNIYKEKDNNINLVVPSLSDNTNGILNTYTHISSDKRRKIANDLLKVSEIRREIVLEILNYACDYEQKKEVRGLYLFGANLYDKDLKINYADITEINRLANRNPDYFDGGRKEWMIEQATNNPRIPASDCSGMEVGYLRKHKLVSKSFDTNANTLCGNGHSISISKDELQPGDWVGRPGHIGTYVGGGYVVEYYGGAFGCQLTDLNNRKGYNFVEKKVKNASSWDKFRKPKYY